MSNVENPSDNNGQSSHTVRVFVEHEEDSQINITGSYVPPNRWAIDAKRSTMKSGSQATSDEVDTDDLGNENFIERAAASQKDIDEFQETRLKSPVEFRKLAIEAWERAKKARQERLQREAEQESDL